MVFCPRTYRQRGQGLPYVILHLQRGNGTCCGLKFYLWLMPPSDFNEETGELLN